MGLTRSMNLSKTMLDTISVMQKHSKLIRYDGGFWSWENIDLKPLYNGGTFMCMVPTWHCDVKTLRALDKRKIVTLDEEQNICILNTQTIV